MNRSSKLQVVAILLTLLVTLGVAPSTHAEMLENVKVPFEMVVFVPCANGGVGEDVYISGYLHSTYQWTETPSGSLTVKYKSQPQGVSGYGLVTGDRYVATGVTQDIFTARYGFEDTYVNNFRIIGQGSGNNLLIHSVTHVTLTPHGVESAYVDHFSSECR